MRLALSFLLFLPIAAQAEGQFEVFSCTFEGGSKAVIVGVEGDSLVYDFGDGHKTSELSLSESLGSGTYVPWPGVGSAIWESVFFYNDGYAYEVWSSVERDPNGPPEAGGINVSNGSKGVAELICDRGTVYSNFAGLSDEMYARGMCWDHTSEQWLQGGCD
jgi:hypothetical protein